ncbi:OadG family protein [Lachnospiraceae bacterium MD1]|uniref:OadG family protein n=1 Tax=Variimorphobacter saccharofermentans TaxID=2755051 RepID=A0A839K0R9_9FIRM|nr:OadG family protein [Variimorphobacter saccharofermentans]MBB2183216.1 OadG family protein [Variimorphobacter saccharofermentans]
MALTESILVALFMMAVVFVVLIMLCGIIRAFSFLIKILENRRDNSTSGTNV